mgnify:CR=1 FL=1
MKQIFTIEILETWVKKIKVIAEDRNSALAQAKADFITEKRDSSDPYIAHDPEASIKDINFQLEWPDGNPRTIEEK